MATDQTVEELQDELRMYKTQPWTLFDTIASTDFRPASATDAIGSSGPAITKQGTMIYFQSSDRTRATMPWYTNLDQSGQLSYGLEVWQIYLALLMPRVPPTNSFGQPGLAAAGIGVGPSSVALLESTILQFAELEVQLGQENQMKFPATRFGAGGGLYNSSVASGAGSNARQNSRNVLTLAEPIAMPRTQNFNVVLRISPDVLAQLAVAGTPLPDLTMWNQSLQVPGNITIPQLPYAIQVGFTGRRVKRTQYGQVTRRDAA